MTAAHPFRYVLKVMTCPKKDTNDQWEALCRQCGTCCFEKYEDGDGTIFYTKTACRYLDIESRRCRIYDRRFAINPECIKLTPELVGSLTWLHPECGYRMAAGLGATVPESPTPRKHRGKRPNRRTSEEQDHEQ